MIDANAKTKMTQIMTLRQSEAASFPYYCPVVHKKKKKKKKKKTSAKEAKSMKRPRNEAIRTKIQPSKPKREEELFWSLKESDPAFCFYKPNRLVPVTYA